MAKLDPRLAPAYSIAQAAHYLKIPAPTVRSWVEVREYFRLFNREALLVEILK